MDYFPENIFKNIFLGEERFIEGKAMELMGASGRGTRRQHSMLEQKIGIKH